MGTKVHCKSYLPGYFSMRDLNDDSSSSSWPAFYGGKSVTNAQHFNGFMPRITIDDYPGYDKNAIKQKMLEHEMIFRNQVCELHRLYRIQRDMMEEVKRKDLNEQAALIEPSSSSNFHGSQMQSEDARKWHMTGISMAKSGHGKTMIMGVEIVKSAMRSTINTIQPSQFPSQNESSSNGCEALDSRPLKVRKKFDLHLPAEEYIDTEEGENLIDYKVSDMPSYVHAENLKIAQSGMKLVPGDSTGLKVGCQIDASASSSCFRGSTGLADLNEPFHIEESATPSPFNFRVRAYTNGESGGMSQSAKSNPIYLDAVPNESLIASPVEGVGRSNLNSSNQGLRQDQFLMHSDPIQGSTDFSARNFDNAYHLFQSPVPSSYPGSYHLFNSSCFSSSLADSIGSWSKSKNGIVNKITSHESPFVLAGELDRNSLPCAQNRVTFGGKWPVNVTSRLNPGFGSKETTGNGLYHGSAYKERQIHPPPACFDYMNCSDNQEHSTNKKFGILPKSSGHANSKPALDINLNEVVSSNKPMILQDLNMMCENSNREDQLSTIHWSRSELAHSIEGESSDIHASCGHFSLHNRTVRDLNQPFTPEDAPSSSNCLVIGEKETGMIQNVKKIPGFHISVPVHPKKESSSLLSSSTIVCYNPERSNVDNKRKNRIIDINLECEPDELMEDDEQVVGKPTKGSCFIDLNSSLSDCEDPPSFESQSGSIKEALERDLEVPVLWVSEGNETRLEGNNTEQIQDEALRDAADAIFAISSSCPQTIPENCVLCPSKASLVNSLLWLVDTMSTCAVELERNSGEESRPVFGSQPQDVEEIDEFEVMTLQLPVSKEEEYMPKYLIPEVHIEAEQVTNSLLSRPRRGQSRRGKHRRDFQRDILPGLASLPRNEVTEDLQIFGRIMKATGHHWNSSLTRRNGSRNVGGRGRRRIVVGPITTTVPTTGCSPLVQSGNNMEAGWEDRSLTGWGKTTRRPRRQRCPAGNPSTVALT